MSGVSITCFAVCLVMILSVFRKGADPLSPGRLFGFVWCLAIGLADLKFSEFQHEWKPDSWILLLTAVSAFLIGTYIAFVLHLRRPLVPVAAMRDVIREEQVRERRLFWLICAISVVYAAAYILNWLAKGWLPIEAAARDMSRVDFNVTGLTFLIYLVPSIMFLIVLYFVKAGDHPGRKSILVFVGVIIMGSFLLFVSRFQVIMVLVLCGTFFYYGTRYIRVRSALLMLLAAVGFFYWISSIRWSSFVAEFLYWSSRMRFPREYAFFTEPYMYVVMNLENFARSVHLLDHHTFGYYTFDFVTAISGLKYWVYEYFNMNRLPYLVSGYNTYTSFWHFYYDFGVLGLAVIPLLLGFGSAMLYYRMRMRPSLKNVTGYGVMVFVILMSFFVFPISFLWFEFNLVVIYVFLRWTVIPRGGPVPAPSSVS